MIKSNNLLNAYFHKMEVSGLGKILCSNQFQKLETIQEGYNSFIEYFSQYILDMDKFKEILSKIESIRYIYVGELCENNWEYNAHILVINGINFEYRTGTGINCKENKNNFYNYYKLFLNVITCIMEDAKYSQELTEDEFVEELGYTEDVKSYKKGIKCYQGCKEQYEKCYKIWSRRQILDIRNIIEL